MPQRLSVPKVKSRMQLLGLNAVRLVAKSELSESTIDRILHGRATNYSDFTLNRLATALECTVLELLDDESTAAALTAFTARAVEDVVVESITENVTAVVESVAPDASPEAVAKSVPNTPVTVPSALDVANYIESIRTSHAQHVADLRAERNALRITCAILAVCLLLSLFGGVI